MSTEPKNLNVREARLPEDRPALEEFVLALNRFEHAFESNRRTDEAIGPEYFAVLMKRVAENDGRVLVAERNGDLVGWLVSVVDEGPVFVREDKRATGYVIELFIEEGARRSGVGGALLRAAEDDFRARGLRTMMIGVMAGNANARAAYQARGFEPYALQLIKPI